jgi:hypothetical protein
VLSESARVFPISVKSVAHCVWFSQEATESHGSCPRPTGAAFELEV